MVAAAVVCVPRQPMASCWGPKVKDGVVDVDHQKLLPLVQGSIFTSPPGAAAGPVSPYNIPTLDALQVLSSSQDNP
jgi:hypothetical protein